MFSIGDTVFYEAHGVCTIVDIQQLTFSKQSRDYYVLAPVQNESLKLFHPVEQENSKLAAIVTKELAEEILETFEKSADTWNDRASERNQHYRTVMKSNDHIQIAQMVNTILRKETELKQENKKLHSQDDQILQRVLPNMYNELSVSLNMTPEDIKAKIEQRIVGA